MRPICEKAHSVGIYQDVGILDKRKNEYLALIRATEADLKRYPNKKWAQIKKSLESKIK